MSGPQSRPAWVGRGTWLICTCGPRSTRASEPSAAARKDNPEPLQPAAVVPPAYECILTPLRRDDEAARGAPPQRRFAPGDSVELLPGRKTVSFILDSSRDGARPALCRVLRLRAYL